MTEIVEAQFGESGRLQELLVLPDHVPGIERSANGRREDEPVLAPLCTRDEPLLELANTMLLKRGDCHVRDTDRAPDSGRLRLYDGELLVDPLKLVSNGDRTSAEVEVFPMQSERLALAKPDGNSNRVERL
jgi:hypothetical protein